MKLLDGLGLVSNQPYTSLYREKDENPNSASEKLFERMQLSERRQDALVVMSRRL